MEEVLKRIVRVLGRKDLEDKIGTWSNKKVIQAIYKDLPPALKPLIDKLLEAEKEKDDSEARFKKSASYSGKIPNKEELEAILNGVSLDTYRRNINLPFEEKVKLDVNEFINSVETGGRPLPRNNQKVRVDEELDWFFKTGGKKGKKVKDILTRLFNIGSNLQKESINILNAYAMLDGSVGTDKQKIGAYLQCIERNMMLVTDLISLVSSHQMLVNSIIGQMDEIYELYKENNENDASLTDFVRNLRTYGGRMPK